MIKPFFPISLLLIIIIGCKKEPSTCCTIIDTNMRIAVQTSSMLDLLDPQSGKFNDVNIEVFDRMESGYVRVIRSATFHPTELYTFVKD